MTYVALAFLSKVTVAKFLMVDDPNASVDVDRLFVDCVAVADGVAVVAAVADDDAELGVDEHVAVAVAVVEDVGIVVVAYEPVIPSSHVLLFEIEPFQIGAD